MEITTHQRLVPLRRTYDEVVNPRTAVQPKRVRIVENTAVRGRPVYVGSVLEFDCATVDGYEDDSLLRGCLKAVRVPITTPLHDAPVPPPEQDRPAPPSPVAGLAAELIRQVQAQSHPSKVKS